MSGLFDNKYYDGHVENGEATPILPPGRWDWKEKDDDLANWKNFRRKIGGMNLLKDDGGEPYGWELAPEDPGRVDYTGSGEYFEGSSGVDLLNLGRRGRLHGMSGSLKGGPDRLVFNEAWSLDFSTSSADCDPQWDDDIVVAGCDVNPNSSFDIRSVSIHTGRGSDLLFVRDAERAGFDAGNLGGQTFGLDREDGDDVAVFRGNMRDFRFYGGGGDDTAVWYVDEVKQNSPWLGPNFFGGGGSGEALWGDCGTDRLVLVIPIDTEIVTKTPTKPGQLFVGIVPNYSDEVQWDGPTKNDPDGGYCITCGRSPDGRRTMTFEYVSKDKKIRTGYFYVTAFEELQIGLGPGARLYAIDDKNGALKLATGLTPFEPPELNPAYCAGSP